MPIGKCLFDRTPIRAGVPHGSILFPLLYVADISNQLVNVTIFTYDDDIAIISYPWHKQIGSQRLQEAADTVLVYFDR